MKITNKHNISLTLAVWLLVDEYDYIDDPNYISVTTLMKPLRQIILPSRVPVEERTLDVSDLISSSFGSSLHASIEKAWDNAMYRNMALSQLGYPAEVRNRVRINPTPEELSQGKDLIPVYIEKRRHKAVNGFTVGGKFDLVAEGMLQDNKSTSTYAWTKDGKGDDYILQGSLYRWLNPDIITDDFIRINFLFTDWQKVRARTEKDYPVCRVAHRDYPLIPVEEIQQWVERKLALIKQYKDAPEKEIPECSDKELWMNAPTFKYYADPAKTSGRSTRNFDNLADANHFKVEKGKGVVLTVPGIPKRCDYCSSFPVCSQKNRWFS